MNVFDNTIITSSPIISLTFSIYADSINLFIFMANNHTFESI